VTRNPTAASTARAPWLASLAVLEEDHSLFIARSEARHIVASGVRLGGGRRRPAELHDAALAAKRARELPCFSFTGVLSDAGTEWPGRRKLVHRAVLEDLPDLSQYDVYACGHTAMVAAAQEDFLADGGLPLSQYHRDAFLHSGAPHTTTTDRPVAG
jgi:NAD(P)H-flavin reductase